jgi:hypothetical protein
VIKEPETNICKSAALFVDAAASGSRAHGRDFPRPATERGAGSRTAPAYWLDGASLGDKTHQKFSAVTSSTQCSAKFLKTGDWGVSMKTAAHYRAMAEECIKWAGEAYTAEVRESYLQLARIWLDTASRLNGLSTGEAAPEEPVTAARSAD